MICRPNQTQLTISIYCSCKSLSEEGFPTEFANVDLCFYICNSRFPILFSLKYGWGMGAFYLRPVLAFGYCRCLCQCVYVCLSVCVFVNHKFVRTITHHPFKLGSPILDQRCKTPWLGFLFFRGDWPRSSRSNFTRKSNFMLFWVCQRDKYWTIQVRYSLFEPEMHLSTF